MKGDRGRLLCLARQAIAGDDEALGRFVESVRALNALGSMPEHVMSSLRRAGIQSLEQLTTTCEFRLLALHGIGLISLAAIRGALARKGLSLTACNYLSCDHRPLGEL